MNTPQATNTNPMATDSSMQDHHPAQHVLADGHASVVGLQFGDEGKGQIVDLLTKHFDLVVRYNGGANAGHSVQIDDDKFALHLIPSGILYPGKLNVVANGVVIDPCAMLQEIDGLSQRGVNAMHRLRVSDRAHVVFPYHKCQDMLMECALGITGGENKKIGTTGRGIGPAYADKAQRSTAIRMGDLRHGQQLRKHLDHVVQIKNVILSALARHCGPKAPEFEPFDAAKLAADYMAYAEQLSPIICDTTQLLHDAISNGKKILFEGANAALLDVDHGTYPFVTSSHCTSLGVYPGSGVPGGILRHVIGIVKLYTSRVGSGPFPTELHDQTAEHLRKVGNEYGTTTGRPRRCGWLDLVAVKYTSQICGVTALACTGLSVLADLEVVNVCIGYRHGTHMLDTYPANAGLLESVEPIYKQFDGFSGPIENCTKLDDLPEAARYYLRFIEDYIGVPVTMTCVGRRRDQILMQP